MTYDDWKTATPPEDESRSEHEPEPDETARLAAFVINRAGTHVVLTDRETWPDRSAIEDVVGRLGEWTETSEGEVVAPILDPVPSRGEGPIHAGPSDRAEDAAACAELFLCLGTEVVLSVLADACASMADVANENGAHHARFARMCFDQARSHLRAAHRETGLTIADALAEK